MLPRTQRQKDILDYITRFQERHGYIPSYAQIARQFGVKSRATIAKHIAALERRGLLLREHEDGSFALNVKVEDKSSDSLCEVKLLGRIAAGAPILAASNIEEYVNVDPALFRPAADFLLRVRGDSMKDADILDRDLLAVHRTNQARNGQIVVARIGDEATVKYYRRQGQLVRLEAANPAYAPIEIDLREQEIAIEGLATGVIRTALSRRS